MNRALMTEDLTEDPRVKASLCDFLKTHMDKSAALASLLFAALFAVAEAALASAHCGLCSTAQMRARLSS